jgi:hypothetical protein
MVNIYVETVVICLVLFFGIAVSTNKGFPGDLPDPIICRTHTDIYSQLQFYTSY